MQLGISGGIGLLFGALLAWLVLRSRSAALAARLSLTDKELTAVKADLARLLEDQRGLVESRARLESALEFERKTSNEKIELLTKAGDRASEELATIALSLRDRVELDPSQLFRLVGVGLSNFQSDEEDHSAPSEPVLNLE